jgi:hypothetical protein
MRQMAKFGLLMAMAVMLLLAAPAPAPAEKKSVQDVFIFAPTELEPGGKAALRIVVNEVSSLTDMKPLSGAKVEVKLIGKSGSSTLLTAETDKDGTVSGEAVVPKSAAGDGYELVVKVSSRLGDVEKKHAVTLASHYRILLTTDKPLYQPSQLIRIRSVALNQSDLAPIGNRNVTLEVADPQGNKVFKKIGKTDKYGIFAADFQLADEIRFGDYTIKAVVGDREADKIVTVKRYVLPKYKVVLDTKKSSYRPGDKVTGTVSANYFFGKPVDGGEVKIVAQAFDVEFHPVAEVTGKTDRDGNFAFELTLPDTFVGQPLEKGDAFIKLDAEVTDLAKHKETATAERKVTAADLRLEIVPEAGKLIPNVENRIYAVVTTPDDQPVKADVILKINGQPMTAKSDDTGIAEFKITAKSDALKPNNAGVYVLAVTASATDSQGRKVETKAELAADNTRDNVILRLDRALYRSGDDMKVEVLSTFKTGSVYLDLIRNRRTIVTRALDLSDGRAADKLALGPDLFGTIEVHAYVIMPSGEVMRDTRVVYIEPADDLSVKVALDKTVYRPGEEAKLTFTVTDKKGAGHAAALGVSIVDESVFAIQEMQPGLLKVYFTLEKELAKPRYEVHFAPGGASVESMLDDKEKAADSKDKIMKVLLAGVNQPTAAGWEENPAKTRMASESQKIQQFASYLLQYIGKNQFLEKKGGVWAYQADLVDAMIKSKAIDKASATDSFGNLYTPEILKTLDPSLDARAVADAVASYRLSMVYQGLMQYYNAEGKSWVDKLFTGGPAAELPEDVMKKLIDKKFLEPGLAVDPWGKPYLVKKLATGKPNPYNATFNNFEIKSTGADTKPDTADDVADPNRYGSVPYMSMLGYGMYVGDEGGLVNRAWRGAKGMMDGPPMPAAAGAPRMEDKLEMTREKAAESQTMAGSGKDAQPQIRVREYFPETLWWEPDLITDGSGKAELKIPLADSITTWRMTALAHSGDGLLGSMTSGLKVFQDFFVDIDFPAELTQSDEVEVPVAVYNYLTSPQTVTLEVREHPGFELLSDAKVKLDLKAGQIDVRSFRVRADKVGKYSLTVYATGSKLSDAIKRAVEIVPNGLRVEVVKNGRITGPLTEVIDVPAWAVPDASRVMVKVYPGVFASVLEGMDNIFRMPSGCFEQTTSTTYPNVMVLAYMKKTKTIKPDIQMKAEGFINLGYQRLLSFEVPGGGFEWFGNPPANQVLTAYGLMEFSDMSKVYNIDEAVITRTQEWLAKQQQPDGSWKPVEHWLETLSGDAFSKSVELNTAYITWALADTGYKGEATKKGIGYLKANLKNITDAYTLALALNALVAANPDDPDAKALIQRLATLAVTDPKTGTAHWEPKGQTAVAGAGKSAMIETTSLILYAMIKAGQNPSLCNQGLAWITQQKDAFGTFESTQATVLSMKALLASQEGGKPNVSGEIVVSMGGRSETVKINPDNSDVLRLIDFKDKTAAGKNTVDLKAPENMGLMYQVLGIYYAPWDKVEKPEAKQLLALDVKYDRAQLKADDLLTANVIAEYKGDKAVDMVILDLGIPPGFALQTEAFDKLKEAKTIEKYTATGRQITVYVRRMEKGKALKFSYQLKAKFPVKAQAPKSTAYEYYNPGVKTETKPIPIEVTH